MTDQWTCVCDDAQLARLGLEGHETPACPMHRPEAGSSGAPALNSDALTNSLTRALGATETTNL